MSSDWPAGVSTVESSPRMRQCARDIFNFALQQSTIQRAFTRHLSYERGVLRVGDDLYNTSSFSRIFAVSIGKAAHASVEALMNQLGGGVGVTGVVCGPTDPGAQVFGFRYYRGGHPLPTAESLKAAEAILRSLESLSARALVVFLLSGGGSALVEKPLYPSISLADLIATYKVLVHSGASITEINAIRKHLSATKGGRLAKLASPAHQLSILISDVPENAIDSIASGPTIPDTTTVERCYKIVKDYNLLPQFPQSVREIFENHWLEETPKEFDPVFERSRWWTVLSNSSAQKAAAERAALSGFATEIDNSCDDWDYKDAADYLLKRVRELRKGVSSVCLISGGEVTVKVTGDSGVGGRNQQFAAYCAEKIACENICVLSAGTDGIDGNSEFAGGIVDGTSITRAQQAGLNITEALLRFNTSPLFQMLGDAIVTGPTGTNVRDIRVLLAY